MAIQKNDEFAVFIENIKQKIANRLEKDMKPVMKIIESEAVEPISKSQFNAVTYIAFLQIIQQSAIDNLTTPLQQHYLRAIKVGRQVDNIFFNKTKASVVLNADDFADAKTYARTQGSRVITTLFGGYQNNVSKQEIDFLRLKTAPNFETMKAMKEYQNLSRTAKTELEKAFAKSIQERSQIIEKIKTNSIINKQHEVTTQSIQRSSYFESASVVENARTQQAVREGVEYKIWVATLDNRTRETHAHADGQRVRINDPFRIANPKTFATEFLMHPHDFSLGASPENVIRCRCTFVKEYQENE